MLQSGENQTDNVIEIESCPLLHECDEIFPNVVSIRTRLFVEV